MENVFDLLEQNKLNSCSNIEVEIMDRWSISRIIEFNYKLAAEIEFTASPVVNFNITDYPFLANSNMSAKHGSGCFTWDCRLQRIDQLARFAASYSDCVYIPNYFMDYENFNVLDSYDEWSLRYRFAGDLKIITRLKPLLMSGIMRFLCTGICLCSSCARKFRQALEDTDNRLSDRIHSLENMYIQDTSAIIRFVDPTSNARGYTNSIEVHCSDDLFEHGELFLDGTRLPTALRKKYKPPRSTKTSLEYTLSKDDLLKTGIIRNLLERITDNILPQKVLEKTTGLKLKYLTNNNIEVSILESITDDNDFKKYNDILRSHIICELPILQNVPLDILLNIRKKECDAFFVYRDTINKLINQYISQHKIISHLDAQEIYTDIIQPKLNSLNAKAKSLKKSSLGKSFSNLIITTGVLTFGLCSDFLPPGWQAALYSLGLYKAVQTIESFSESIKTPNEIRNDNLYFLWKLSKKHQTSIPI